jgi:hypothetical protein
MRTLYFDINGTLLVGDGGAVKPRLGEGRLEDAVRAKGFERLVCVSTLVRSIRLAERSGRISDPPRILFELCRGAFRDEAWFRDHTVLPENVSPRLACIDLEGDWWYLDDFAAAYCGDAGRDDLFSDHEGGRICQPEPRGDGADIIRWIDSIPDPGS